MDNAGLHQLRFYPREVPESIGVNYLDATTRRLFDLPLSSFVSLASPTANKRKYRKGYTFENKILLFVGDYTKRYPLTIEINGGAFDSLSLDLEKIGRAIDQDYSVTAIHAKIDTTDTPFRQLYRAYQHDSVTAASLKRSDRQSNTKTLYFGNDPQYVVYEAGRLYPELDNVNTVRHEIRATGNQAQQLYQKWREAPDNLVGTIKGMIGGQFKVMFRDHTSGDSNVARRPLLPIWERWLSTTTPQKFERTKPAQRQPTKRYQILLKKVRDFAIEEGLELYEKMKAEVDALLQQRDSVEPLPL